jgi:hypothetical protein
MVTIEINKRTKAAMAFLEYCRTLPFAKVKMDDKNPSPSGDPWWDIPENKQEIKHRIREINERKVKLVILTSEEKNKLFCT